MKKPKTPSHAQKQVQEPVRPVSGIEGLEELIHNGIPSGTVNLIAGPCGTGKSTFAMQFLNCGAQHGEPGLYISLENEPEDVIESAKSFGWDFETLVREKKLIILKPEVYKFNVIKETIADAIDRFDVKRIVIDPFSLLTAFFNNTYDVRKSLSELRREMKKFDATLLAITDIREGEKAFSPTGFEEFVVNGVIVLGIVSKPNSNEFIRTIFIRKITNSPHSIKMVPFEITKNGIVVYSDAEVF